MRVRKNIVHACLIILRLLSRFRTILYCRKCDARVKTQFLNFRLHSKLCQFSNGGKQNFLLKLKINQSFSAFSNEVKVSTSVKDADLCLLVRDKMMVFNIMKIVKRIIVLKCRGIIFVTAGLIIER